MRLIEGITFQKPSYGYKWCFKSTHKFKDVLIKVINDFQRASDFFTLVK